MNGTEPASERFDLLLTHAGANRIGVVKAVREGTGLGLKESVDLVGRMPCVVAGNLDRTAAEALLASLLDAGAAAEITSPGNGGAPAFAPSGAAKSGATAATPDRALSPELLLAAARTSDDPQVRGGGALIERGLDFAERAGILTRLRFATEGLNVWRVEFHSPLERFLNSTATLCAAAALLLFVAGIDPSARLPLSFPVALASGSLAAIYLRRRTDVHHAIDVSRRRILRRFRFAGMRREHELAEFREIAALALDARMGSGRKPRIEHAIAAVRRDGGILHLSGWSALGFEDAHESTRAMAARMSVSFIEGGKEASLAVTRTPGGTLEVRRGDMVPRRALPLVFLILLLAALAAAAIHFARL